MELMERESGFFMMLFSLQSSDPCAHIRDTFEARLRLDFGLILGNCLIDDGC